MKTLQYSFFCVVFFITSCISEKNDWEKIRNSSEISSFENFIKKYPAGEYKDSANINIEKIFFEKAIESKDSATIMCYLRKFPNGNYADTIKTLKDYIAYVTIADNKDTTKLELFIKNNPNNKYITNVLNSLEQIYYNEIINKREINLAKWFLDRFADTEYKSEISAIIKELTTPKFDISKCDNVFEVEIFPNGHIKYVVKKGNLHFKQGTTCKTGSVVSDQMGEVVFDYGNTLIIVGEKGVVFNSQKYFKGSQLFMNKNKKLILIK